MINPHPTPSPAWRERGLKQWDNTMVKQVDNVPVSVLGSEDVDTDSLITAYSEQYNREEEDDREKHTKLTLHNRRHEPPIANSRGIIITFNPDNPKSVDHAKEAYHRLPQDRKTLSSVFFVAMMTDKTNRVVAQNLANQFQRATGCRAYLANTKTGENITHLFKRLKADISQAKNPTPLASSTNIGQRSATSQLSSSDVSKYNSIWSNPQCHTPEERMLAILNDYSKGSAFTRFLKGDWNYVHVEAISKICEQAKSEGWSSKEIIKHVRQYAERDVELSKAIEYMESQDPSLIEDQNAPSDTM